MATPEHSVSGHPPPPSPTPEWGTESVSLKDYASKFPVPGFAKVVKGNYMTLGSNKFSFQKQYHEVFIHSVKVGVKVLAHCLRRMDATTLTRRGNHNIYTATRLYAVDQRLAIPISYQGWFELLSEDGKSARPIVSVHELAKVKPDRCLVRENIKAYILSEDGSTTFDKSKIVIAGEQLLLAGEIELPSAIENKKIKLLKCFDSEGKSVYLSFDQKGTFTPIATEDGFNGVFNIRDIVRRFRLPLTVKLVQGVRPKVDPARFTGLIRLDWVYTDDTAFVCPVDKNIVRLLPVPVDVNLQLVAATNQKVMKTSELYRNMMIKCNRMIANYNNTLHLIVQVPEVVTKSKGRTNPNVFSQQLDIPVQSHRSKSKEHLLMDEIDDLYAYVRDGGPPPNLKKFAYDSDEESYWEEPAYEPLDEFRARLQAIEAGQRVNYHEKYRPQDPSKLNLDNELRKSRENLLDIPNSDHNNVVQQNKPTSPPPPLPPRHFNFQPSADTFFTETEHSTNTVPQSVPIRTFSQSAHNITTVSNLGLVSSTHSSSSSLHSHTIAKKESKPGGGHFFSRSKSNAEVSAKKDHLNIPRRGQGGSQESTSTSGSSGNGHRNHIARDFKDSDISSMTKGGSSGSSGGPTSNIRKKMQTLYL